jgi:hypothetical protein
MAVRSWFVFSGAAAGASLEGLKEETHRQVASGGGLEIFASWLAVSPRAGSGNSLLSRSRGNRHGRLGRNSLGDEGNHTGGKNSTREGVSEEKVGRMAGEINLTHLQVFP